jgi:hypothetical protein
MGMYGFLLALLPRDVPDLPVHVVSMHNSCEILAIGPLYG